jgi:hypothetical protein
MLKKGPKKTVRWAQNSPYIARCRTSLGEKHSLNTEKRKRGGGGQDKEKARVLGGKVNENVTVFFECKEGKDNFTYCTIHMHSAEFSTIGGFIKDEYYS